MVCITETKLCDVIEGIVSPILGKEQRKFPPVAFERAPSQRGNVTQKPVNISAKHSFLDLLQPTETAGEVQPHSLAGFVWHNSM